MEGCKNTLVHLSREKEKRRRKEEKKKRSRSNCWTIDEEYSRKELFEEEKKLFPIISGNYIFY